MEQRYDALLVVIRDGMRVTEVAEKLGVHRDRFWSQRAGGLPSVTTATSAVAPFAPPMNATNGKPVR